MVGVIGRRGQNRKIQRWRCAAAGIHDGDGLDSGLGDVRRLDLGLTVLALTKVVVRALLFHRTVEFVAKLAPVTVTVKSEAPATTLEGESEQIAGALLEETRKLTAGEKISVPPPV